LNFVIKVIVFFSPKGNYLELGLLLKISSFEIVGSIQKTAEFINKILIMQVIIE